MRDDWDDETSLILHFWKDLVPLLEFLRRAQCCSMFYFQELLLMLYTAITTRNIDVLLGEDHS